jgi:hypothetical protein
VNFVISLLREGSSAEWMKESFDPSQENPGLPNKQDWSVANEPPCPKSVVPANSSTCQSNNFQTSLKRFDKATLRASQR